MLQELRIRSLGVIDDALLELSPGLNVVTGETGAGKTMVVQGLGLLLGGRADPGLVREGSPRAVIEGVLDLPKDHIARQRAVDAGGDDDPEEPLLLARTVAEKGRSRATVAGRNAPVGVLAEIGEAVVAVHGQADQWRLKSPDQHREMLDKFGGDTVGEALAAYRTAYAEWQAARAELERLRGASRERAQRLDQLTAALEEIEAIDPQPGEDDELAAEAGRLEHQDQLREAAARAHNALVGEDDATGGTDVLSLVASARQALEQAAALDPRADELRARAHEVAVLVTELATDVASYLTDLDADPARLQVVQERRADLGRLLRKYGDSVTEVLAWSRDAAAEAATLAGSDDRIAELTTQLTALDDALAAAADELSQRRRHAGEQLASQVSEELAHLAMGKAVLGVGVESTPGHYTVHGIDQVEITLAATPSAKPRNVARAASGGELSRVMLALEVVTADGTIPTFVFDEVDAGVGGRAALDIGARLHRLAAHAQVIVVTHLAQVAAYADRHLVVHKQDDGHVTHSDVRAVEGEERVAELARMLGGGTGKAALAHARDLLAEVRSTAG
ncbi:DNA repair protein RecN [Calidifontibacter sp. DB0510]|uniref:DNA repair protein RecN n=1 Tax=Metallococcus carri TaxID=1656884 RepID=A0A967E9C2_9MICO|nr:DNA repair protein RecN [Metallococcus carri]NHN55050.1 DNA repair protein RecN [Metallococcus carri]NOP37396.1 DNA repair protein RecN [Calidifontibacter sp. DB2511S]